MSGKRRGRGLIVVLAITYPLPTLSLGEYPGCPVGGSLISRSDLIVTTTEWPNIVPGDSYDGWDRVCRSRLLLHLSTIPHSPCTPPLPSLHTTHTHTHTHYPVYSRVGRRSFGHAITPRERATCIYLGRTVRELSLLLLLLLIRPRSQTHTHTHPPPL